MSKSTNQFIDDVQRLAKVRRVEQRGSLEQTVEILGPVAAAHSTLTYGELATRLGWDLRQTYHKLLQLLNEISETEDSAGRGMLSAVVVGARRPGMPGGGYFSLARRLGREGSKEAIWRHERELLRAIWTNEHSSHQVGATAQ